MVNKTTAACKIEIDSQHTLTYYNKWLSCIKSTAKKVAELEEKQQRAKEKINKRKIVNRKKTVEEPREVRAKQTVKGIEQKLETATSNKPMGNELNPNIKC